MNKDKCCHKKKEEVKKISCCQAMENESADEKCVSPVISFEKNFTGCGCIHNFNPTRQNIQIVKTQELTKVKVYADISDEWNYQQVTSYFADNSIVLNTESPPIYLTVSSFLI
ncbi:MAG: hypothetical protein KJ571_08860 [Bacteroidetes bacterium]|nr:hypothetical protein [Bacteroidota bacterium]